MKTPAVDYRQFRLRKIGDPEFSHLKLLAGWIVYFLFYFLTETLIPAEKCHSVHCFLDDWIPFREYFVIPYVLWYLLIIGSLIWFGLYNIQGFRDLSVYIIITQAIAIGCYIFFPTRQDLRPEVFSNENFCTALVAFLYSIDTNTGVCPSLHVAYSLGIASVWLREKQAGRLWKGFVVLFVISVCPSTMFIKQHSALDFFAALPVCLAAELITFRRQYFGKRPT